MAKKAVDQKEFEKIKKQAQDVIARSGERDSMYDEIADMYWMEDSAGVSNYDDADIKMTVSPSARNEVIGMVRLLTTSRPRYVATSDKGDPDKIEDALDKILQRSNEVTLTKVATEAARCAVLYSDVHLMVELVDDMLAIDGLPDYEKRRLEDIRLRTPFLISAINPREGYPIYGKTGMRAYLRKYKAWGADIAERWGIEDLDDGLEYTVNDWYGMQYRVVWLEEKSEPLMFAEHGMPRIPIVAMISDGTNLFREEEKKRQPFLYAKWKGGWWKRENLLYTTLFTSMYSRGTGPLAAIDPDSLGPDGVVDVNYAGPFRYITAKAQLLNDKAFDADLIAAKGLLDQVGGESTIYKQTLGENLAGSNTAFSTLAMLSQSGRLPLVSPQETIADAFRELGYIMLRWIKAENIKNAWVKASEIGDDMELECKLEVNLPQDMFRNAQIAASLKGLVSGEWIHSNLLQIDDSNEMRYQVWSEEAANAMFQMRMQEMAQQAQMKAQQMAGVQQGMPQQSQGMGSRSAPMGASGIPSAPPQSQGGAPAGMDPRVLAQMMQGQGGGQGQIAAQGRGVPPISQSGEKMPLSAPLGENGGFPSSKPRSLG